MTLALSIADDFASIVDGLNPVTVGTKIVNAALRRAVTVKQAAASNGKYLTSDVTFHLDRAELPEQPKIGSTISDADGTWTILAANWDTFVNRWRCTCRRLKIDACSTVSIQRATFAKSATGAAEPTWATVASNVSAKVQIESANVESDRANRTVRKEAFVYFATEQALQPADRIISGSTTLKVLSWDGFDSLEQLFRASCEVSKWPQS